MSVPVKIKSTYSLDAATVRQLDSLARRWNVSKSEVIRRAIRAATSRYSTSSSEALRALDRLQESHGMTRDKADEWATHIHDERRARR